MPNVTRHEDEKQSLVVKNSPKVVLVELSNSLTSLLISVMVLAGIATATDGWKTRILLIVTVIGLLSFIRAPINEWLFVSLRADQQGIVYKSGIVFRDTKKIAWQDIALFDQDSDPLRATLGGKKLTVVPAATDQDVCALSFVSTPVIEQFTNFYARHSVSPPPQEQGTARGEDTPETKEKVIFNSPRKRDILRLAVGYGELLIGIPLLLAIADNLSGFGVEFDWDLSQPVALARQVGMIVAAVIILGVGRTYLSYGKWKVTTTGAAVKIESGVLASSVVTFPFHTSIMTTIKYPIGLRIFGQAQLRSVSASSAPATSRDIIIPIVKREEIPGMLSMIGVPAGALNIKYQWPRHIAWLGLFFLVPQIPFLATFLVFLLALPAIKVLSSQVSFFSSQPQGEIDTVVLAYGLFNKTVTIANTAELNSLSVRYIQLGNDELLCLWSFKFFAHRTRSIRGFSRISQSDPAAEMFLAGTISSPTA